jgi:ATP phosphoribosyltransferase
MNIATVNKIETVLYLFKLVSIRSSSELLYSRDIFLASGNGTNSVADLLIFHQPFLIDPHFQFSEFSLISMNVEALQDRLLFAIPKKGRLNEKCLQVLAGAGIEFKRNHRLDIALSTNLPIALVFLNASDIAQYVGDGNIDIGLTGQDMVAENAVQVEELLRLGFGKCKLQVLVPENGTIQHVDDLIGKRVVTSFDTLVNRFSFLMKLLYQQRERIES